MHSMLCVSKRVILFFAVVSLVIVIVGISRYVQNSQLSSDSRASGINIYELEACKPLTFSFEKKDNTQTCEQAAYLKGDVDPAMLWNECMDGAKRKCQPKERLEGYPPYNPFLSVPLFQTARSVCTNLSPCDRFASIIVGKPVFLYEYFKDNAYTNSTTYANANCNIPCKTRQNDSLFSCYTYDFDTNIYTAHCYDTLNWDVFTSSDFTVNNTGNEEAFTAPHTCTEVKELLGVNPKITKSFYAPFSIDEAEKGCGSEPYCLGGDEKEDGTILWQCYSPPNARYLNTQIIAPRFPTPVIR